MFESIQFKMDFIPDSGEYFGVEVYESQQGQENSENESSPVCVKSASNKFYPIFKLLMLM